MLDLESKKSTEQEKRDRLKILIPNQMLSRLPISLAQLKAENNSGKRNQTTIVFFVQIKKPYKKRL